MRAPRRRRALAPAPVDTGALYIRFIKNRLAHRDTRTTAEFLADHRAMPVTPATAQLLDRLERASR